jgi:hypothetical protein
MSTVTAEIFDTCHFPETMHAHGPGMWVYGYTCTEHPRLQIKDTGDRKRHTATRYYLVDGKEVADRDAAVAALNVPVVVTPEEQAILDTIPTDWTDCPAGGRGAEIERQFSLRCKGLVEWQHGRYRRRATP